MYNCVNNEQKSCKYFSYRFNRFSTHIVASSSNFANNFHRNNTFFLNVSLDSIIVYCLQYLLITIVYICCALTAGDGKNTIIFRDYTDFEVILVIHRVIEIELHSIWVIPS